MKSFSCVALTAALVLFSSLSNAGGTPTSSFVPRSSHEPRATLGHKHHAKPARSAGKRNQSVPRLPPPK
jgi:hypothetical protein